MPRKFTTCGCLQERKKETIRLGRRLSGPAGYYGQRAPASHREGPCRSQARCGLVGREQGKVRGGLAPSLRCVPSGVLAQLCGWHANREAAPHHLGLCCCCQQCSAAASPQAGQQRSLRLQLLHYGCRQAQRALRLAGAVHVAHNENLHSHLGAKPGGQVDLRSRGGGRGGGVQPVGDKARMATRGGRAAPSSSQRPWPPARLDLRLQKGERGVAKGGRRPPLTGCGFPTPGEQRAQWESGGSCPAWNKTDCSSNLPVAPAHFSVAALAHASL